MVTLAIEAIAVLANKRGSMLMLRKRNFTRIALLAAAIAVASVGCTKRPSEEELAKLEQATQAAEAAERKLAELRQERMALEQQLESKKQELQQHEAERDDLKQKMEEHNAQGL
jgi:septal ring factor EnvC (AmiA/AmiB activator)